VACRQGKEKQIGSRARNGNYATRGIADVCIYVLYALRCPASRVKIAGGVTIAALLCHREFEK